MDILCYACGWASRVILERKNGCVPGLKKGLFQYAPNCAVIKLCVEAMREMGTRLGLLNSTALLAPHAYEIYRPGDVDRQKKLTNQAPCAMFKAEVALK